VPRYVFEKSLCPSSSSFFFGKEVVFSDLDRMVLNIEEARRRKEHWLDINLLSVVHRHITTRSRCDSEESSRNEVLKLLFICLDMTRGTVREKTPCDSNLHRSECVCGKRRSTAPNAKSSSHIQYPHAINTCKPKQNPATK
jgi:hypothetical protein